LTGPHRNSDTDHDSTGTPRWVKVFGIVAALLILLFLVSLLAGFPGGHGPGRHTLSAGAGGHGSPSSGRDVGMERP
jgi:hypothetical protein